MTWSVVIDPVSLAGSPPASRTELDLNNGPIMVDQKGVDWGDAAVQTYLADQRVGSVKIDFRMPNRKVTIPLFLMDDPFGGLTEEQARSQLQQKVGLLQMNGGWLMRQRAGGPATYTEIVDAILTLPDVWGETGAVEPNVNLLLECSPDFYGDEIVLDVDSVSGGVVSGPLQLSGSNAVIEGDHLGRASVVVTDLSAADQGALIWAFRSTYYDSAPTAALVYDAENLDPVSPATTVTVSGRVGVRHSSLSTSFVPVVNTNLGGISPFTHLGSYRVRARVLTTSTVNVWARLVWGVGAAIGLTANDLVLIPGVNNFYIIDLGEIRVDFPPIGTLRWEGQIQAQGASGLQNIFIDQIYLQPLDDAAGYATANSTVSSLSSPVSRDFFNQTAGNLAGKTADLGGTWSEPVAGAGDFQVDAANDVATRAVTDAAVHYAVLGSSLTDTDVSIDIGWSNFLAGTYTGVLARYVDTTHWFGVAINCPADNKPVVYMMKANGGAATIVGTIYINRLPTLPTLHHLQLVINVKGLARAYLDGSPCGLINDPDLATGGALASGQCGFWEHAALNTVTRWYDNFLVYPTSQTDAVCFGSSSATLRYDGLYRADTTDTYFGPIANVVGDLPRIPPSGMENRPVELFLMLSRGNLQGQADLSLGSFTAQVRYRPVYIHRA